jgi:hypothetical protein
MWCTGLAAKGAGGFVDIVRHSRMVVDSCAVKAPKARVEAFRGENADGVCHINS